MTLKKNYFIYLGTGILLFTAFVYFMQTKFEAQNIAPVITPKSPIKTFTMDTLDPFELHFNSIVVDTHNDLLWQTHNKGVDIGIRNGSTQTDLPRLKEGGLDVQVFAIWIPMKEVKRSFSFVSKQISRLQSFQQQYPDQLELAYKHDDIIRITSQNKIAGLIGVEGGTAIHNDINNVNELYNLGVRYIGLTWNNSNNIASSARDETERSIAGGLTPFGIEVVKRMDELGMLIDVSHLGEQSFWDVAETSKNPLFASHSNAYSIHNHYRNLNDEQLKAIAKSNGVVQVNFHTSFLGGNNMAKLIQHIDHIKNTAGIDHIGIGSDYDGGITPIIELSDGTKYPMLTKALIDHGYSQEDVRKILGENFLRVFKKVCG